MVEQEVIRKIRMLADAGWGSALLFRRVPLCSFGGFRSALSAVAAPLFRRLLRRSSALSAPLPNELARAAPFLPLKDGDFPLLRRHAKRSRVLRLGRWLPGYAWAPVRNGGASVCGIPST